MFSKKSYKKSFNKKFDTDLKFGKGGEDIIIEFLKNKGFYFIGKSDYLHTDAAIWKTYDLLFRNKKDEPIRIEVKTDKYVFDNNDTGNLIVEKSCNGKKSGIDKTTAKWWINYFINLSADNLWMIEVDKLKALIKDNNLHGSYGGDNNKAYSIQIPRKDFKKYFKVFTIQSSGIIELNKTDNKYVVKGTDDSFLYMPNPLDWD